MDAFAITGHCFRINEIELDAVLTPENLPESPILTVTPTGDVLLGQSHAHLRHPSHHTRDSARLRQ
ncbi:MAG: hypothetical protein ACTHQM_25995 [Thermoanaerobaculia bacterium]